MKRWERFLHRAKLSGTLMVAVGFLLRLGSVAYQLRYHLNPALDHWRFGWEMGRVGRAIYEGRGFSSPMYQPSGPTAWLAPVYPLLIAAAFKLFGLYTAAAAWFVLGCNALFGALTALPVRATARRLFGGSAGGSTGGSAVPQAQIAGWTWALLPYGIYLAGERIWENTLTTLLAATLLWLTYVLAEDAPDSSRNAVSRSASNRSAAGWRLWTLFGLLWGFAALTSPTLLSALPAMGLWVAWRHHRAGRSWFIQATAAALIFFALLAPWMLRNNTQFHRFIPMRDNFWLEVHVGNNGDERQPCPDAVHPSNSARERQQWTQLGEIAYMDAKKVEAMAWLHQHPRQFVHLTLRRALFVWTGFWTLDPTYLEGEPMELCATAYFTLITLLAAAGFILAWRNQLAPMLWPMWVFLFIFPIPYYITHPSYDYRHAMDPILIIMAVYACTHYLRRPRSAAASVAASSDRAHSPIGLA